MFILSLKVVLILTNSADPHECSIMLHSDGHSRFDRLQCTRLAVSSIQRVRHEYNKIKNKIKFKLDAILRTSLGIKYLLSSCAGAGTQ